MELHLSSTKPISPHKKEFVMKNFSLLLLLLVIFLTGCNKGSSPVDSDPYGTPPDFPKFIEIGAGGLSGPNTGDVVSDSGIVGDNMVLWTIAIPKGSKSSFRYDDTFSTGFISVFVQSKLFVKMGKKQKESFWVLFKLHQ